MTPSKRNDLLAVADLVAGYGTGTVLNRLCLGVSPGTALAIVGRNGAGKSTFASCVAGLVHPRSGSILLDGRELVHLSPAQRWNAGVGLVPQGRRLFPSLSVDENLRIGRARPGVWNVDSVYTIFEALRKRQHVRAGLLSGGEQQMLAIGRALLGNPRVVLFDEPSEGLSVPVTKLLAGIISTLRDSGTGVVLVEQNLSFALSIADAVSVMRNGVLQDSQERSDNGWDIPALESAMGIRRLEAVASITSSTDTGQRMESDGGNRG